MKHTYYTVEVPLMGRSRYKVFDKHYPYFLTCTTINWLPIFNCKTIIEMVLDSLEYLQNEGRITLYSYVVMVNHIHLIVLADNIGKEIGCFKSYTARKIIDYLENKNATHILKQLHFFKKLHKGDREHQLWQEGSHPQMIFNQKMMKEKVEYIHNNPVKVGWVDDSVNWKYSSAGEYCGKSAGLSVDKTWFGT